MTLEDLIAIEQIKRLKYKYARCLDLKLWDELAETLTADVVVNYSNGKYHHEGRDNVIAWIKKGMAAETFLSSHKMHHPEITITSATTATGIWALDDRVIMTDIGLDVRGCCFYNDEYVKLDGEWKIFRTGYKRVYEEIEPRSEKITLTASFWGTNGQSSLPA